MGPHTQVCTSRFEAQSGDGDDAWIMHTWDHLPSCPPSMCVVKFVCKNYPFAKYLDFLQIVTEDLTRESLISKPTK